MSEPKTYIVPELPDVPFWMIETAEIATIILSILGVTISLFLTFYFNKGRGELASRLRCEYFTDFLAFIVLLIMGVGLYTNFHWLVRVDVIVRPFVVALNIYAMWRLYKHYRSL